MGNLTEMLWKDYNDNNAILNELGIGTQEYKIIAEEKDKIRNELIKMEQIKEDRKAREQQTKSNDNNELIKNKIAIITFAISTLVSIYTVVKTFKFDQEATITSTLGRNIINNVTSKIFKR